MNYTRFPKENHLPYWADRGNKDKKGDRVDHLLFNLVIQPDPTSNLTVVFIFLFMKKSPSSRMSAVVNVILFRSSKLSVKTHTVCWSSEEFLYPLQLF